ncbi:MAG TPA: MFS transporter [Candidatus Acidoferrales bacterium]|nr:MFS transporter [Candidatus Acidoferrales bacterium]
MSAASWRVLILLGFSIFINYVDRGNLSIAAPLIKNELKLSPSQLGILLSSFFWLYTLVQLPVGWLIDRFNVNWILAIGFFIWSAATGVTGILHGFTALLIVRLLLGIAESVAFPSYGKIFAHNFHEHQRGVANGVIGVGQSVGAAFASLAGGVIMSRFGWRPFFVVSGLICLPWCLGWLRWAPPAKSPIRGELGYSSGAIIEVLQQRSLWGISLATFCANYMLFLLLTWLPYYLVQQRHFSLTLTGEISGAAFLIRAVTAFVSGRLSDRWISAGKSPTLVLKSLVCVGSGLSGCLLVPCAMASDRVCVLLLFSAVACQGFATPHFWNAAQALAGPRLAGTWTGLQVFISSFGSILGPLLTGFVVQATGGFVWAFALAAIAGLLGVLCWVFMVGPVRPVAWAPVEESLALEA